MGLAAGASSLSYSHIDVTGANLSPLVVAADNGAITVSGAGSVPEPSVILLLTIGGVEAISLWGKKGLTT